MQKKMSSSQVIDKNYIQLGQIAHILNNRQRYEVSKINAIINSNFDVNYKLPNSFVCQNKPHLSGYTALHFIATSDPFKSSCFSLLIKHGADFAIENDKGVSPLVLALKNYYITQNDSLLFSHLTENNIKKCCKDGISFFHVACSLNELNIVDLFLKAGASVNERVNDASPEFPGYSPLHFATQYGQLQTIELLLHNNANMNSKDVKGITPLHLLVKNFEKYYFYKNSILSNYLSKMLPLINLPDDVGLTKLHISCVTDNVSLINSFINQDEDIDSSINYDSPVWPGYTPLHVASNFYFETVIFLLKKGADILVKDASGRTPFDLCIENYKRYQIIEILSTEKRHNLSQLQLTDGTILLDILRAMRNKNEFQEFLKDKVMNVNIFIPFDSQILSGWNLLHIAVMFDDDDDDQHPLINYLLSCNADFTMVNADGKSPLHLAFCFNYIKIVRNILDNHDKIPVNYVNQENLSHLHIACAMRDRNTVDILLKNGADPNLPVLHEISYYLDSYKKVIRAGSTPFHLATNWIDVDLFKTFLSSGANINARDVNGIIPIHSIFYVHFYETEYSSSNEYCSDMAIAFQHLEIILEEWLKSKTDILSMYRMTLLLLDIADLDESLDKVKNSKKLIKKFIEAKRCEELGLTKLQIACVLSDMPMIKEELETGADVNQQIVSVSGLWVEDDPVLYREHRKFFCPGDTPLHIYSRKWEINIEIVKLLLAYGANSNLKNANNSTPVHLSRDKELQEMLLSNVKFPIENPVNNDGLSHFHLCCKLKNLELVEKYLKAGVNVNATVNYFADFYAGYTPLHFAVEFSSVEVFELLLKYGADLNIEAANGFTPLLTAIKVKYNDNIDQMKSLLSSPSIDNQIMRLFKETVLESIFEDYNYNAFFLDFSITKKIEFLLQSGCELNQKDNMGKTILHKTSIFVAVDKLLLFGADVNIKDDDGKTPYVHYQTKDSSSFSIKLITDHIRKLKFAGLFVDQSNKIDYDGNVVH